MTQPISLADARAKRRATADAGQAVPTPEQLDASVEELRNSLRKQIAAGDRAEPISTWQQVADSVDEPTWQRILGDLSPETRAECELLRRAEQLPDPEVATRQAEALNRLRRQATTRTKDQP